MLVRGDLVHCPQLGKIHILRDYLIAVDDLGYIIHCEFAQSPVSTELLRIHAALLLDLPLGTFLLPPFVDLHLHAPQFLYQGTGLDLPLLEWLDKYAFQAEEKLDQDIILARKVYRRLGQRLIQKGTGSVCLFGTLKTETNLILAEEMQSAGLRAFVGKVSMDISSRPSYVEASSSAALAAVRDFGARLVDQSSASSGMAKSRPPLVHPVITPRFVPTCSDELLHGLGTLAEETGWRIQSHMAESSDQVEWVKKERGEDDFCMFEKATHCTYLSTSSPCPSHPTASSFDPFTHLQALGTAIAHCPLSNIYFSGSQAFCLREALDAQIKVGLGTDIAGGYSLDIMSAMRTAVAVSRIREGERQKAKAEELRSSNQDGKSLAIDWKESLFLATLGGARALGIKSGTFSVGAPFDAQQIRLFDSDTGLGVGVLDFFELEAESKEKSASTESTVCISEEMIEKWWCNGDERNRIDMWIQGRRV
ncbi:hypothetical protein BDP27DRAFT_1382483 [Rhodocollybia butyracea]|uniref:Amidohydrolase-related domain-containing protein n=1 Tax=Rhodocollybia butyracea TaxID=206335 RepID=A0A9P5PXF8_9AGAR|nr:hypothetical protein BDP27DRAFT_1382483 [Rhodocollybia butyracea]